MRNSVEYGPRGALTSENAKSIGSFQLSSESHQARGPEPEDVVTSSPDAVALVSAAYLTGATGAGRIKGAT